MNGVFPFTHYIRERFLKWAFMSLSGVCYITGNEIRPNPTNTETNRFDTENFKRIVDFVFHLQLRYLVTNKCEERPACEQKIRPVKTIKDKKSKIDLSSLFICLRIEKRPSILYYQFPVFDALRALTSINDFRF